MIQCKLIIAVSDLIPDPKTREYDAILQGARFLKPCEKNECLCRKTKVSVGKRMPLQAKEVSHGIV